MYLFFDTETTGLPKNYKAPVTDVDNWPRIIQLAFIVVDVNFNEMASYSELIRPDGWEIPNEKFWIENGYSTEVNMNKGVPIRQALAAFAYCVEQCTHKVAHNLDYDNPVLGAEMIRYGVMPSKKLSGVCTMKASNAFCALKNSRGGSKWPKLLELHEKLFGYGFDGAHDALADVSATVRCAKELQNRGLLTFN